MKANRCKTLQIQRMILKIIPIFLIQIIKSTIISNCLKKIQYFIREINNLENQIFEKNFQTINKKIVIKK